MIPWDDATLTLTTDSCRLEVPVCLDTDASELFEARIQETLASFPALADATFAFKPGRRIESNRGVDWDPGVLAITGQRDLFSIPPEEFAARLSALVAACATHAELAAQRAIDEDAAHGWLEQLKRQA